jgi:hypothetical protein
MLSTWLYALTLHILALLILVALSMIGCGPF